MLLFRLIEFRGRGKVFSDKTKFVRRFGTVAFSNYNNQFIYFLMFCITSSLFYFTPYARLPWWGTFVTMGLTFLAFHFLLKGWEKLKYTGSLEWFIRTASYNIVPARKDAHKESVKWWQKGQIDPERTFYNPEWIDLSDTADDTTSSEKKESKFSFKLSIIALCSILFVAVNIMSLFVSLRARKLECKNKHNTAGLAISITGIVLLVAIIIVIVSIKTGALGLF